MRKMIDVKLMTEEAYKTLQANYEDVFNHIKSHPSDSSWLKDYLGFDPYEIKEYKIEDFSLELNLGTNQFSNAKKIYESINVLPKYITCNNRFWAWITFEKAYRLAIESIELDKPAILKNWWLAGNSRRDLCLGVISRLYFKIEMSVDDTKTNKYELSEFLFTNNSTAEAYRNLVFRNIGMLPQVSRSFLKFQKEYERNNNSTLNQDQVRDLMKMASQIGSVRLIDAMTDDEIYNILKEKWDKNQIHHFLEIK